MIGRLWMRARARCRGGAAQAAVGTPRVYYGRDRLHGRAGLSFGGTVKFQLLQDLFPNTPRGYNLIYLVSSGIPPAALTLVREAKARGARFVWNQNGVGFPAWHGPGWEKVNAPMRGLMALADHVFYQSAFCRAAADRFVGPCAASSEILHNAVDTARFLPVVSPARPFTLLVSGSHWQWYRVQVAIDALGRLRREIPDARLIIAGRFCWDAPRRAEAEVREYVRRAGLEGVVEFIGPYSQQDAPAVLARGDVLVHLKCNDPCPTLVLEALACGLPVVYSASGGTPELVGDAGLGIASRVDWDVHEPPAVDAVATALLDVNARLAALRGAARARAEQFDAAAWRKRHADVFHQLMMPEGGSSV